MTTRKPTSTPRGRRESQPTEPESWALWCEWKRVCALGGCGAAAQTHLHGFAHHRFHLLARRVSGQLVAADRVPASVADLPAATAWHLFESHLEITHTRAGKRYKDWLFARLREGESRPLGVIEAGATVIMRDVVREYLRQTCSTGRFSLQAPLADGEGVPLTLEDLLPGGEDPVADVARAEYPALAARLAQEEFATLPHRLRVAVFARGLGLGFQRADVEKAAGCRKSMLSAGYASFRQVLRERVARQFADEGPAGIADLLLRVLQGVQDRACLWAKSETTCSELFRVVEGGVWHEC